MSEQQARLKVEVWRNASGGVTVTTETPHGSGTRLCGVKLNAIARELVATFFLDRDAVDAIVEDFNIAELEAQEGGES